MTGRTIQRIVPAFLLLISVGVAFGESHLMRYADVHQDKIVFTYEGDLWLVSSSGGDAHRITRDAGSETYASFSPDGSKIAFTGQYDGGTDVYVMDAKGGVPTRLTYHPAGDRVLGWHPDGKRVLFRSNRKYPHRAEEVYLVSIDGGMPEQLPVDRAGLTTISPDGKSIAYNRQSRETRTWKRHQGGTAQDVWMGELDKGNYRRITEWAGSDNYPMWYGDAIYFVSDRENGTLNIFKYDTGTREIFQLTDYSDYDVKYPAIGDGSIIYQYKETLHLLDLKTEKTRKVEVNIPSDRVRMRPEYITPEPGTGSFRLSPTGKRMLLDARGEILNLPVEDGEPVNLTRTTGYREKNGVWSPDGKWIAYLSDQSGEEEIYLVDQKGEQPAKQLTKGGLGFRNPLTWSPDSRYIIFSDKFLRLNLVDAESGELSEIARADYDDAWERWGIQDYVWSPDSKWIAYTKMEESMNEAIFLYSLEKKESYRVTDEMYEDFSPSFDPDGKYLYFLSNRTYEPVMGFVDQTHVFLDMCKPYIVILAAGEPSPFAPKDSEENITQAKETDDEDSDEEADDDKAKETRIDIEGINQRIIAARDVPAGNYFRLEATADGFLYLKKTQNEFTKYQTVTDETGGRMELYSYKLEDEESSKVLSGIANYHLSNDLKKLVYRSGSTYGVVDTGKDAKVGDGEVKLSDVRILVDRNREYLQIFNEAWRVQRDWFYDANMHGVDWNAIGEKYRKFVPYCGNRTDLNYLIGEMIGELNIGHTYIWGGDIANDARHVRTGMLGIETACKPGESYYYIAHIIPGTPGDDSEKSPLTAPDCPIKQGDYIIAINGETVTTAGNVFAPLQNKANKVVTITYNDRPTDKNAKTYRATTISSEQDIRYREWVNNNRAFVDKASGGKLGYLHIPDMGAAGVIEFSRIFHCHYYKDGFVIDERYNGGGFTADMIIDRLERKMWGMTQPREGKPLRDPERIFHGPMVVMINKDTGSSGEMFAEAIKRKNIAPLLGMRTWGGSIGIEPHQHFVDGGTTTPPQFGLYGLDQTWLIEGHGVDPDIEVENMPGDVVKGKDAQLEAAIDYLLRQLKKDPVTIPEVPAYPDKSKKK